MGIAWRRGNARRHRVRRRDGTGLALQARMSVVRMTFDRGSLVLEGLPRAAELWGIPGVLWDARAGGFRAPAGAFYALASELRRRGVPLAGRPVAKLAPPVERRQRKLRGY